MSAFARPQRCVLGALWVCFTVSLPVAVFAEDGRVISARVTSLAGETMLRSSQNGCVGPDVAAFPTASRVSFGNTSTLRHDYIHGTSYVRERWTPSGMNARWITPLVRLTAEPSDDGAPQVFTTRSEGDRPRRLYLMASVAAGAAEDHFVVRKRAAGAYQWASSCGLVEIPLPADGPFQATFIVHGTRGLPAAPQDGEESRDTPPGPRSRPILVVVGRPGSHRPADAPFVLLRSFDPEGDAIADQR